MFEVTKCSHGLIFDKLELTATSEMIGVHESLDGEGLKVLRYAYRFPNGSKMRLHFPRWRRFQRGQTLDVSTVLKHPAVQTMLSARKP